MEKEAHPSKIALAFIISFLIIAIFLSLTNATLFQSQPTGSQAKDTYILENNINYGYILTPFTLRAGKIPSGVERRILLEFNVSSIPSNNIVISAKIGLYAQSMNSPSNNMTLRIYKLTSFWNKTQANWYNSTSSQNWTNAGGDYNPTYLDEVNITSANRWYNFSIDSAAREWVNGSSPNYGVIIIPYNTNSGNYTDFYSSGELTNPQLIPTIWIDYTTNALPALDSISTNSNSTNPIQVGQNINFMVNWSDLDSTSERLFICSNSSINISGCQQTTFCSTSYQTTNPLTCSYQTTSADNRTTPFWAAVCDATNCTINSSSFYVNHLPTLKLVQPNGGEVINQSLGNYQIKFNVSDADSDSLFADIYYGQTQNSTSSTIASNINLSNYCSPSTFSSAQSNCSYSWNSTGMYGNYYITIKANDTFSSQNISSSSQFNVFSLTGLIPPLINATWFTDTYLYSGKVFPIYANVTSERISSVWIAINSTPQQIINMTNTTFTSYDANTTALAPGNYEYVVYAQDILGNQNQSLPVQFTVIKPNATFGNLWVPQTNQQTYSPILVSADFNITDPLRDLSATIYTPSGLRTLDSYPKTIYLGNYSANQTLTTDWLLSSRNDGNYTLNVTYSDPYGNNWSSLNSNVIVNSSSQTSSANYFLSMAGYSEVASNGKYYVEINFAKEGQPSTPDSINLLIYDSLNNLVVGPITPTNLSTGNYSYSYTLGSSINQGPWKTIVYATKDNGTYYASSFFNVIGGPFDVGNINIINNSIDNLNISILTENKGNSPVDMILNWNLTKEDTGESLISGTETKLVGALSSLLWYINPQTNYIGQVRFTAIGYYSGTEKAVAYKIFNTAAPNESGVITPPVQSSGGGGGGGGGSSGAISSPNRYAMNIFVDSQVTLTKNLKKTLRVRIENNGSQALTNLTLNLGGLDSKYYSIYPPSIAKIDSGSSDLFLLDLTISDLSGELNFSYILQSNELTKVLNAQLNITGIGEYFTKEIELAKIKINSLNLQTKNPDLLNQLKTCSNETSILESLVANERYLDAQDQLKKVNNCIYPVEDALEKIKNLPPAINYTPWIIVTSIIFFIILIILLVALKIRKRLHVLEFFRREMSNTKKPEKESKEENFNRKLEEIEKRLSTKNSSN